jgi:hypothetical protein
MQEIPRENLIPGKEYYLQNFEEAHSPPNKPYKMIGLFEKLEPSCGFKAFSWACFSNFRKIEHRNDPTFTRYVCLGSHWKIYEMPRQKVQKTMENRSYNMILLDLIRDENFIGVIGKADSSF